MPKDKFGAAQLLSWKEFYIVWLIHGQEFKITDYKWTNHYIYLELGSKTKSRIKIKIQ